jgi:hypothetical protein
MVLFYQLTWVLLDTVVGDVWKHHLPGESSRQYVLKTFFQDEYLVPNADGGCTISEYTCAGDLSKNAYVHLAHAIYHEDARLVTQAMRSERGSVAETCTGEARTEETGVAS